MAVLDSGVLGDHPEDVVEVPEHVKQLHVEVFVHKELKEEGLDS